MDEHRLVHNKKLTLVLFEQSFSSFAYVDARFGGENPAIRRLFSLARSHHARTFIVEEIEPAGIIADENEEIKHYAADYQMKGLERISFWRSTLATLGANIYRDEDCVGYAILKHDVVPSRSYDKWHVFEAVFEKYLDEHNCVPNPMKYSVVLGSENISLKGLLYAQQNTLNKVCAQVALRSLISRIKRHDVSYREINELARRVSPQDFDPSKGLSIERIRAVLTGFKIDFRDTDYTLSGDEYREHHPYQKHVYAGVESGAGALLGFHFTGPAIQIIQLVQRRTVPRHIIPFYGHTFNKDTWMPEADIAYFRVGERLGYIPSENWTSSFLGHDDNFGPCFCIPRLYISKDKVDYVVELLRPGVKFSGAQAEALALLFLYSVLNQLNQTGLPENVWLKRLVYHAQLDVQTIILRAIAVERDTYIRHLSSENDWDQNSEEKAVVDILHDSLPNVLWIVEVSIPQLFPANERKLGDIVLNAETDLSDSQDKGSSFLFVRLPSCYFFALAAGSGGANFLAVPSKLISHFPVIKIT
jgi:hypothetical protein